MKQEECDQEDSPQPFAMICFTRSYAITLSYWFWIDGWRLFIDAI